MLSDTEKLQMARVIILGEARSGFATNFSIATKLQIELKVSMHEAYSIMERLFSEI